ncbi:MAG: hypothetical protein JXK07_04160 [Spirochaetes bacterium]|nr:hypothetical protein [Spirochaetota bacterium]MBN2770389.1 hypothetical protein [Spirochaetota bacterium]
MKKIHKNIFESAAPYLILMLTLNIVIIAGQLIFLYGTLTSFIITVIFFVFIIITAFGLYLRRPKSRIIFLIICSIYSGVAIPSSIFSIINGSTRLKLFFSIYNLVLAVIYLLNILITTKPQIQSID